jgi:hypothetical protein
MRASSVLNVILLAMFIATFCLFNIQSASGPKYDPLYDVNDDGKINILDLTLLAIRYGTQGIPMNRTSGLVKGYMAKPAWDSGWKPCAYGTNVYYFNMTVDAGNAVVYMVGKNSTDGLEHQLNYGGEHNYGIEYGVDWRDLSDTSIVVFRYKDDPNWNYVRIMIWEFQDP